MLAEVDGHVGPGTAVGKAAAELVQRALPPGAEFVLKTSQTQRDWRKQSRGK